jgi:hypothetical protein
VTGPMSDVGGSDSTNASSDATSPSSRRDVGEGAPPYLVVLPELLFVVTAAPR